MEAPDPKGLWIVIMAMAMLAGVGGILLWELLEYLLRHMSIFWN